MPLGIHLPGPFVYHPKTKAARIIEAQHKAARTAMHRNRRFFAAVDRMAEVNASAATDALAWVAQANQRGDPELAIRRQNDTIATVKRAFRDAERVNRLQARAQRCRERGHPQRADRLQHRAATIQAHNPDL